MSTAHPMIVYTSLIPALALRMLSPVSTRRTKTESSMETP